MNFIYFQFQLKWWDVRKLSEPLETLIVDLTKGEPPKLTRAHGISVLEYENSIPIRFMVKYKIILPVRYYIFFLNIF